MVRLTTVLADKVLNDQCSGQLWLMLQQMAVQLRTFRYVFF